jgi:hypothetical protein
MELYKRIIEIVDANLINCLIPIILTLIIIRLFFKNRFETKKVLNLIRWTIILYAIITWTFNLIGMAMSPDEYAFINRATGPYKIAYWIMFLSALILPFTLFIKKLASKFWYVLLVVFGMKIGFYFERFVIIVTSYHRDYLTENGSPEFTNLLAFGIGMILLQGVIIAILTLGIFEIIKRKKTGYNKVYKK